uniref:Zinc finger protein 711 n=1 Tax=Cacopsylla melanoneura TaxID=428564 RepID=A0A8D8ZMY6_9HEMI
MDEEKLIPQRNVFSEFPCPYCKVNIEDQNTETLLLHGKLCPTVVRPDKSFCYVCLFCEFHAYDAARMRRHIRTHIGEKPYKCPYCPYSSSQNINVHIKIKHGSI